MDAQATLHTALIKLNFRYVDHIAADWKSFSPRYRPLQYSQHH